MIIFFSGSRSKKVSPDNKKTDVQIGVMLTFSDFNINKNNDSIKRFEISKRRLRKKNEKARKAMHS